MQLISDSDPRLRVLSRGQVDARPRKRAEYVLYWCQAFRRPTDNVALNYAIERANELGLPCVVYEAIRTDYPFASDRFHAFVLEGAEDMARALERRGLHYAFFLPKTIEEARGVVVALSQRAALVVSDDTPMFLAAHNEAAARKIAAPFVVVDDNSPVPLSLFPKQEYAARTIRPKVHKLLPDWLKPIRESKPTVDPPARLALPFEPVKWSASPDIGRLIASCAIDHLVPKVAEFPGGQTAAERRLSAFLDGKLKRYADDHNEPARDGTSHLSPYLHFGMISARRVALAALAASKNSRIPQPAIDAFIEQLVVRRTLAFNFARSNPHHARYDQMPDWAKRTLAEHQSDPRPALVSLRDLDRGNSPDEVWNAAQFELRARGIIHNYLRMLWGKLVFTWTKTPAEAYRILVHLNDKYALDGRDPDGYTNIGWCFGLHDRPWPEHAIFGKVRTMTSRSARSKLDLDPYLRKAPEWKRAAGL